MANETDLTDVYINMTQNEWGANVRYFKENGYQTGTVELYNGSPTMHYNS